MRFKWEKNESASILSDPALNQTSGKTGLLTNVHSEDDDSLDESEASSLNFIHEPDFRSQKNSSNWNIYQGILFSCLSSVFFSMCSVIVKSMNSIHPGQLAVFRFSAILFLSIPLVYLHNENFFGPADIRHFLVLRGILGSSSLFLRFCAFRSLPFVEASVIIFSVPVIVTFLACVFLKEPCGFFQTFVVGLTMTGLCLTVRLPSLLEEEGELMRRIWENSSSVSLNTTSVNGTKIFDQNDRIIQSLTGSTYLRGVLEALSSTVFAASVYILIRKAKKAHYSVIMFNFGLIAIVETSLLTLLFGDFTMPNGWKEWMLIVALMLLSFFGQILLTKSLQIEQAAPVAIVRSATDIILAFVWQVWFFSQTPDPWSVIGALIVTFSIVLTSLRKWILSLPQHSSLRDKFHLIR
ncbi:solute carrier family 35 member G1-like [Brevipalpus obovatus]|uniref:solute carrier family 35 member G1-like n=1 Tax=Brevipalpus obovatus TaxID=246614 RepID=UPI003D9E41D7